MTLTTTTDKPTRSPTTLEMIARGDAASPAYLDVEATLTRARYLLDLAPRPLSTRRVCCNPYPGEDTERHTPAADERGRWKGTRTVESAGVAARFV